MSNYRQNPLGAELVKWKTLRDQLEDIEGMDETCLVDTLEGETDLKEAILAIEEEVAERDSFIAALANRINALKERKERHEKVRESLRTIILHAMDNAHLPNITEPHVTITVKELPPEVVIEHEDRIPAEFWVPNDPSLDKKLLLSHMLEGEQVEGASLGKGRINLTIRRK